MVEEKISFSGSHLESASSSHLSSVRQGLGAVWIAGENVYSLTPEWVFWVLFSFHPSLVFSSQLSVGSSKGLTSSCHGYTDSGCCFLLTGLTGCLTLDGHEQNAPLMYGEVIREGHRMGWGKLGCGVREVDLVSTNLSYLIRM